MKRILQFILIACLASGCVDAGIEEVNQSLLEVAPEVMPDVITISLDDDTTRVQLDASGKTVWTKDDYVSAFYMSDANNMFRFDGETGDRDGKFKIESMGSATTDIDNIVLLYPYSSSYKLNAAKSLIDVYIPSTQYYAEGSYGVGSNLMASVETDDNFTLRSLCGWIVVQLEGDATITSITLSGNNGEQLAGDADFDYDKFNLNLVYYPENSNIYGDSNGGGSFIWGDCIESVTLDCGDGVKLNPDKPTEFYFVVPPQIFTKGINIKAECQRGEPIVKSSSKSLTVQRNHIVPMSTITANEVIPNNQIWYISTDGTIVEPKDGAVSGGTLVSNTCVDGMGIMTFSSDVTALNQDAFNNRDTLQSIILPNSLISIGDSAFFSCSSLTSVTIPDSVTTIGKEAFRFCSSLTSVTIGNGVTSIGEWAFGYCYSLTSVTIPDSVTSIGEWAFYDCSGELIINSKIIETDYSYDNYPANDFSGWLYKAKFTKLTIGDNITEIGDYAFCECSSLTSLTIGNSVTSIGERAFYYCTSLTSVTIPDSVTTIGSSAFYGCSSLESVTIPDSVTSIGISAFSGCTSLTSVTIPDSVTSIGISAFSGCTSLTSVTIPDSVTSIGDSAFYDCESLTSVTIPDSVTSIGDYAFRFCSSLESVTIPDSVTTIGDSAFSFCDSLDSVTIPDSVTSIGQEAFYSCDSLTSVTIGNGVTTIGQEAFSYCYSLKSFYGKFASEDNRCLIVDGKLIAFAPAGLTEYTIPDSVTTIGNSAFEDCSSLTSVTIPNSVTKIGSSAFYGCSSLTSITIPDSVTSIGEWAFGYCSSLESVTIPDSVTTIGKYAFSGCRSLTSVTIPDSVTTIGDSAFYNCSSLTSVTIPDSVTSIGDDAFEDCTSLTSVTIPNSVTKIGSSAFSGCSGELIIDSKIIETDYSYDNYPIIDSSSWLYKAKFTKLTIGDNITEIGDYAFCECSSLTSLTIGNSVTSIGERAFYYCTSLTSVTLPVSVTSIEDYAFKNCTSLTSVYCKAATPPAGGYGMFESNASDRKIYVLTASVEAYKSAAGWSRYKNSIVGYEF